MKFIQQDSDDEFNEKTTKTAEQIKREKISKKKDFLEGNKPVIEDLSSHKLYFDKETLKDLATNNFV
jgi:hypothetical protein